MSQLRFYFGERDRVGDRPLDVAVMEACERRGVRAAVLLRGVEGFGARARLRTDRLLTLSEDAPLVAVAVGDAAAVEGLAADVRGLATDGLIVVEEMTTIDTAVPSAAEVAASPMADGPGERDTREGVIEATIWGPRTGRRSPHLSAVAALHRCGAEAATVLLGVDGVLDGERRRARFAAGNRGVPAITVAVGERAAIEAALRGLDPAPSLVTVEAVASKSHRERVARRGDAAVRTTLVTSEIASHDRRPTYLELIDALRREGAPGATALRGVWGFRGTEAPHGDRVLALRRDVPVVVEVVDGPERAEEWRKLALSLTCEGDVVYSSVV
jgi:PII-like signaling protein